MSEMIQDIMVRIQRENDYENKLLPKTAPPRPW